MEELRSWTLAVCFMCIAGHLLGMLVPENQAKKTVNMIITLILLCVMLRPLGSLGNIQKKMEEFTFENSRYESSRLESEAGERASRLYAAYLEDTLGRVLIDSGLSYERISVNMNNSENGSISIGQVEVMVKAEDVAETEKIKTLLHDYIGTDPVVIAEP